MSSEIDFRNQEGGPIKRLIWSTDLHLDSLTKAQYRLYFDLMAAYEPDIVLIGGDISNGETSLEHLKYFSKVIGKQIYFVFGNHDYYYGSIKAIRAAAHQLTKANPSIVYLTENGIIPLSEKTALIGHDGWSDARAGDFFNSEVSLNDYFLIDELKRLNQQEKFEKLHELGSEAANYLSMQLEEAFKIYDRIVLLTHVPPFEEACICEGAICDASYAPHFVGQATGQAIEKVMRENPTKQLLILCGHSHGGVDLHILSNLWVIAAQSELGTPNIQGTIYIN